MASVIDEFSYDVFLSFRGTDTRYGFTGNLWKALCDRGIRTFMDDEELRRGEEITPSLVKAIKQSRMAIIVLSKNYAFSSFCLQELSKILDCSQDKGRSVWPVFYEVDPSHVRKLSGTYGEAMTLHEARLSWLQKGKNTMHQVANLIGFNLKNDNMDRLQKWKKALHHVANLSGFHFKNGDGYEHEFIGKIVEQISREIKPITLRVADYLVGQESQKQNVKLLLNVGFDDRVRMVGIHGIGGIGKTTLALEVYNSIAYQFEGLCFLEKVRENSEKHGLLYLQKILLSEIVREKKIELTSVTQGISIIQQRLWQKKVLLILDDVDKLEQLQAIVGRPEWFGPRSRVIITTRDKHLLTCHGVESIYEMKELNKKDAFELLRWKAFKTDKVIPSYVNILNRAVTYASGLPLALEVIGSHLFKKGKEEWESTLDRYERIPNKEIQKILKVSFDALEEEEKNVFLDIVCCFKGDKLAMVEKVLHAHHGDSKKDRIGVLVEKSLIKISESGNVTLHDLIEDMGKEIVRQESPEEPGKRSRLWSSKDIVQVLEENTGTSKIEIIYLDSPVEVKWNGKAFKKMENLRTLIIRGGHFSKNPELLPNSLRVLEWWKYPSQGLPYDFHPTKLAICKLTSGDFTSFVRGDLFKKTSKFESMRVLNLDFCRFLTQIPDVSSLPNLEELSFQYCRNLITIDDSVRLLDKLIMLNANHCSKLTSFPPLKLASLEQLNLSYCANLESFSSVVWLLDKLKILSADHCQKIRSFPPLKLASLEQLDLSYCVSLESFPPMDRFLGKLKILTVKGCSKLRSIPRLKLPSLEQLDLSSCDSLESFPEVLGEMENITQLHLDKTPIKKFPFSFHNLTRLQTLYLRNCGIVQLPSNIVVMSELAKLTIENGGWLFPKQDEVEEKVSQMQTSQVEFLHLLNCNLSNESLVIGLKWFANVKELYLSWSKFTILPECIERCHFLWKLILDNCKGLQEIKGIPPSLKFLSALNCNSLTLPCKSKLLNQELHEAGNTSFLLPHANIPEWFDHRCIGGLSISFWFRNKFPAIALCVVSELTWNDPLSNIRVIINGNTFFCKDNEKKYKSTESYHLHLFHMQMEKFNDNLGKAFLEKKWNHAEVVFELPFQRSGIHVLKRKSSMKDIQFTNP